MSQPIALVAGYIVRYPLGGMILHQLHYLVALQRLGYDVVFVEDHGWPQSCYDPVTQSMTDDPARGLAELQRTLNRFGLKSWTYRDAQHHYHGLTRDELRQLCRQSTVLINLASTTWLEEFHECRCRVYIDTDPAFTQFQMPATAAPSCVGYASPYDAHFRFTFGERISAADCPVPRRGLVWQPTRQPVVLNLLPVQFTPDAEWFTTVMSVHAYTEMRYEGECYGQKDVELAKFADLPQRVGARLEIAASGDAAMQAQLRAAGWRITSAQEATRSLEDYVAFLGRSRGEFSVAKNGYVKARTGWFSERTANYLALGKPAVVQDTGFSEIIPCGAGLFAFTTADDAVAGIEAINRDYVSHCRSARRIVEEYFDASRVVGALLGACDLPVAS